MQHRAANRLLRSSRGASHLSDDKYCSSSLMPGLRYHILKSENNIFQYLGYDWIIHSLITILIRSY